MSINSVRDIFFTQLIACIEQNDLYIVAADVAGKPFDKLRDSKSTRFVQVGIAEQNLIAVSCGIALTNKKVITYSMGGFLSTRAYDQIRNAVSNMKAPLTIVVLAVGLSLCSYGNTHIVTEDRTVISLCPGIEIIDIVDEYMVESLITYQLSAKNPIYIRMERESRKICQSEINWHKGYRTIKKGEGVAILTYGYLLTVAIDTNFCAQPTIIEIFKKPYDVVELINEISSYNKVIVYEEQQKQFGLGCEIINYIYTNKININVTIMGIDYNNIFPCEYRSREEWLKYYFLDSSSLIKEVENS